MFLLARYLCIYSLQKSRLAVAVKLAQRFLAVQVKLKFPPLRRGSQHCVSHGRKERGMRERSRARLVLLLGGKR